MTPLVPIMLFGWVPMTVIFFLVMRPRTAVLCSVIGGSLFLPMAEYKLTGLPEYSKVTAIAFGLILGGLVSGHRWKTGFRLTGYDLPMVVWCFGSPLVSSLVNGLGLHDGLSGVINTYLNWGVFYWAGRIYFNEQSALRDLSTGVIIGGLLYIPFCLFEVRMSPQLSSIFYGFFPHNWVQHIRYGGYRPIVFMQHGLMVALWMAQSSILAYWLWQTNSLKRINGMAIGFPILMLFVTAVLCKSVNALFFLLVGVVSCHLFKITRSAKVLCILLLIPLYIGLRIAGGLSADAIRENATLILDAERVESLSGRLEQEDLFSERARQQTFFGWGGWTRVYPIDPKTGGVMIITVDALWTIYFSARGLVGLVSLYLALLLGPWLIFRGFHAINFPVSQEDSRFEIDAVALSLLVIFFMVDSLMNSMVNPVYILCSGALISYCIVIKKTTIAVS